MDPKLAKLTTFITPFGRYYFNRLPFEITSMPNILIGQTIYGSGIHPDPNKGSAMKAVRVSSNVSEVRHLLVKTTYNPDQYDLCAR